MSTALVSTDASFGPWCIPSRGQNMIMNFYAVNKKIDVDTIIPEPLFSRTLSTTRWVKKNKHLTRIILSSIHQIPTDKAYLNEFINDLKDVEIHFSLEDISGKGEEFLRDIIEEVKIFEKTPSVDYQLVKNYQDLVDIMQEKKPAPFA
jgi:hypothetical protein